MPIFTKCGPMTMMDIVTDSINAMDDQWIHLGFTKAFRQLTGQTSQCENKLPEFSQMIDDIAAITNSDSMDEGLMACWLAKRYIDNRYDTTILYEEKQSLLRIDLNEVSYNYLAGTILGNHNGLTTQAKMDIQRSEKMDLDALQTSSQVVLDLICRDPYVERERTIHLFLEVINHRVATDSQIWLCTKLLEIIGPSAYTSICQSTGMRPLMFVSPYLIDNYRSRRLRTRDSIVQRLLDHTTLPKDLAILVADYTWDA